MARVVLIIPREQRAEYESVATSFAGVPDCEVIVDRRMGERRSGAGVYRWGERRQAERRSSHLGAVGTIFLYVR
jgi:hypothetical protein